MSWYVTRAERSDVLADALADLLATPLPDPLTEELVVVPAKGMERWLTQRLSHRLGAPAPTRAGAVTPSGVCAGVRFTSPRSLVAMLTGRERDDPWDPDRLVWPLLDVIDACLDEQWCAPVARHLGHGRDDAHTSPDLAQVRAGRRYSLARRLAGLFASYGVQRPQVLTDWRAGRALDGAGAALDPDLAWQPELWRRLVERVDADPPDVRHDLTVARLRDGDVSLDLPGRMSLFGHTRIAHTEIELLAALATRHDVHLWLPQASAQVWHDLADVVAGGPVRRAADTSARSVGHPLLASLGRDSRELMRTLASVGPLDAAPPPPAWEVASPPPATTLAWLQHDLRAGRLPTPAERASRTPGPDDLSVRVHACHGPARQVEVLREVLLGLLADDPTLEPRDIVVLCPDIEAYAPLVQAAFGLGSGVDDPDDDRAREERHPGHRLRVRLADRALTATNPLAALASSLLELTGGRMRAADVLDLAASEPVRRRFGFDDDDLERIRRWVDLAAIRWGRDAAARDVFDLGAFEQNTWRFGLDRLLLGVAVPEQHDDLDHDDHDSGFGAAELGAGDLLPALPVDDVAGGDIDLVGRLAEFVDRIGATVERLEVARVASDWVGALADGVRSLADVDPTGAWMFAQLDRELAAVVEASSPDTRLRQADVRGLLAHRFAGHPTRANFRTGTLTVATMVPMRSVPHRVVALLGLDDGVFPRTWTVDGDDVLARNPMTGERDPRSEDRQLLLDAVMSATEHLVVTYTGAGEHTGAPRPPAVPVGELLDAIAQSVHEDSSSVVVHHRLQPFAPQNFVAGSLGTPGVFSFDAPALEGARALLRPRGDAGALVPEPLPPAPRADVDLDDLVSFVVHPVRHFLRGRLDVSSPLEADEPAAAMPVSLDSLEKWAVGDRLLGDALAGVRPQVAVRGERLRGLLPPGGLADPLLRDVTDVIGALVTTVKGLRVGDAQRVDVDVDLGGGRRLAGTVGDVYASPTGGRSVRRHVTVAYSSLSAKRRLEAWVTLLALSASDESGEYTSFAVGRRGGRAVTAAAGPLTQATARDLLADLVDVYDRGMREPLPAPPRTAFAYAEAFAAGARGGRVDPVAAARQEWEGRGRGIPGEAQDPWHVRAFGADAPVARLLGDARAGEDWNTAPDRLGRYALRVWEPILAGQVIR